MYYRLASLLLLLSLLSSCTLYDHIFHPHRLGSPPMTASAKAKAKAAEKARHKGLTLGAPAADGSPAGGDAAPPPAPDARSLDDKNKAIADMLGNTYSTKTGLLKRSKLQQLQNSRRQLHHYDTRPLTHNQATRAERKLRKHPKPGKSQATEPKAAADPEPAPSSKVPNAAPPAPPVPAADEPVSAPAPVAKPAKFKQDKKDQKAKKDKKAPKADPTQPLNGDQ